MLFRGDKLSIPPKEHALPGRSTALAVADRHFVLDAPMNGPFEGKAIAMFGMGCFWGPERRFWETEGVLGTAVGYAGGHTENPTYHEVCSGGTAHAEVVRIVFDPERLTYEALLKVFWENHDPTQRMRQGNDVGTQYRSAIYAYNDAQSSLAGASRAEFQQVLTASGFGEITTEIEPAPLFYFAEDYHQQYLAKNPHGYCGVGGTGCSTAAMETLVGHRR